MTVERQRVLLGVLMLLLVFVAWRQVGRFLGGGGGRSRAASAASRGGGLGDQLQEVVEVRLDGLERQGGRYRPGRDPFRFGPPSADRTPKAPRTTRPSPVAKQPPPTRASKTEALRLPPIDLVYLGNFGPTGRRIAVFSDGEEILNAMIGDVLQGSFEVVDIGYESVDLGYVDFPESPPARLAVGG